MKKREFGKQKTNETAAALSLFAPLPFHFIATSEEKLQKEHTTVTHSRLDDPLNSPPIASPPPPLIMRETVRCCCISSSTSTNSITTTTIT